MSSNSKNQKSASPDKKESHDEAPKKTGFSLDPRNLFGKGKKQTGEGKAATTSYAPIV